MTLANKRNLLLAGAALLGMLLLGSVLSVVMLSAPEPVSPSADALEAVNISLAEASQNGERDFVERPLFWASRRPQGVADSTEEPQDEDEVVAPTEEAGALDKAQLVGLYAIADGGGGAILLRNGAKHRVAVNEDVFGWTLISVDGDTAVFSGLVREGEPEVSKELVLEHAMVGAAAVENDATDGASAKRKKARRNQARKQSS